ncbi:phytoene/squalene synthase family protein [Nocardia sp. NPDC057668]|uniref:phytoene/squalene synthase family protein n=1 Tax=Nocardia sp. NPDC057668 TaxID=3346202 RepID=UPI00366EE0B1
MSPATLDRAYRDCRRIAAAHGRTYFLATRLLEPERRPAVHALYAFARLVDDLVDTAEDGAVAANSDGAHAGAAAAHLDRLEYELRGRLLRPAEIGGGADHTDPGTLEDRVLLAVSDTIRRYAIAPEHFWVFLDSMRMDIPGSPQYRDRYPTMTALREYMRGSAAAIGLQLLPVLGTVVPVAEAEPAAAALGEAFQLTNFLRDVAEDLDRGRVYLPADDLAAFGVDRDLLLECRRTGTTDPRVRRAVSHLIAVNRDIYRRAVPGIDLLLPRVRPAIRTAATLYGGILEEIERRDHEIFSARATVPTHRRLRVAAREFTTRTLHPAH